nr:helix-turn-helix domain-containing protein [Micromonospora sp. DSM 115978]
MTSDELAEFLSVPKSTIYNWRRVKTGPPWFKVGKYVRYDLDEVLAWLEAKRDD